LLWSKPMVYWDYIQTDALLGLQVQRTTLPDEMIFIMYHQVNDCKRKIYGCVAPFIFFVLKICLFTTFATTCHF